MKEPTLQQHHSTAVHVERLLPEVVVHPHRVESKMFRIRPKRTRSCTSDSHNLKSAETQKSESTTKDFVAPAGISRKGSETALGYHRLPVRVHRPHELSHPRLQELVPLRPMHIDSAMNTNKARGREPVEKWSIVLPTINPNKRRIAFNVSTTRSRPQSVHMDFATTITTAKATPKVRGNLLLAGLKLRKQIREPDRVLIAPYVSNNSVQSGNRELQLGSRSTQSWPVNWKESILHQQRRAAVPVARLHPRVAARVEVENRRGPQTANCRCSSSTLAPPFTSNDSL
jgi:hypothetical protein